jgi:hypothetical protein
MLLLIEPEVACDIALVTVRGRPDSTAVGALVRGVMRMAWISTHGATPAIAARV